MKIGLTGYRGRVGKVFLSYPKVVPLHCDVTNLTQVRQAVTSVRPDLIVHLAAKSDVDWCEDKKNEQSVIDVNFIGTSNVATVADSYGCRVVLLSSDHVFSGKRWFGKYKENETPQPLNFYGLSKLAAEGMVGLFGNLKVVRTSTLFDSSRIYKEIKTMEDDYPTFLKRSFLYIPHFCNLLHEYCQRFDEMPNVLHLAGIDSVSYYTFMSDLADHWKISGEVRPRRKDLTNGFAPRGHNLGLDVSQAIRLGFHRYSYLDGIREMTR